MNGPSKSSKTDDKRQNAARKRFERAMVDSTDLLAEYLEDLVLPVEPDGFLLFELGRLVEDGDLTFENDEFRLLIEQGILLSVDPDLDLRARMTESLRRNSAKMSPRARRITPEVIGAIEDADFSLDQVGAIVRCYTNRLIGELEATTGDSASEEPADKEPAGQEHARLQIEAWKKGTLDRQALFRELEKSGSDQVPAVADLMFDSLDDSEAVDIALELLQTMPSPLAARVVAYMVSEPILEEAQEVRARQILKEFWPLPRTYMLYRLKQHTHEDLPFRWLELLIEMHELRAVDRILEELVAHARNENYKEDLLAILTLLDRSPDPGVIGKLLRLMTDDSALEAPLDILEEWLESSPLAQPIEEAVERWNNGKTILVPASQDFNAFATSQPDCAFDELSRDWDSAYHESLGWQQRSQFKRGPVEQEFENELEEAKMQGLSLNPGLDEDSLRDQIESFQENWLVSPRDNVVPLVAIYLERPRDNPWLEDVYQRELNGWYIRAAQYFDEGNLVAARQLVDIVLQIEPDYPLARMLDGIVKEDEQAKSAT
jgi:hypothetical protein